MASGFGMRRAAGVHQERPHGRAVPQRLVERGADGDDDGGAAHEGGVLQVHAEHCHALHDEQQLALVFPEGTKGTGKLIRERYQLRRFGRGGFVEIAMRSGVPIVPIAVVGNEEAMPIVWKSPRLAKLLGLPYFPVTANNFVFGPLGYIVPFPSKFKIRVLPPVYFDVATNQDRYNRSLVMEQADAIRASIQEALFDMLSTRHSVWRG